MKKLIQILLIIACTATATAQTKIAVLPFSNLDGNYDINKYCYELSDSLTKAFQALDPEGKTIKVLSIEEVGDALSEQNVDPNSPTFDADKWKIVASLGVDRIISGTFRISANRIIVNGYIYYPESQLSDPDFQAKDIFKKPEKVMDAISIIVKRLKPAFFKNTTE
jgi:TolB-like protein